MNQKKNCEGLSVLEIGSGRGGGLAYIANYLNPLEVVGVDLSDVQIKFCKRLYSSIEKLSFVNGNAVSFSTAEELQGKQFDLVINVESSHCYQDIPKFVEQVSKVLKDDGVFCITDFRRKKDFKKLKEDL